MKRTPTKSRLKNTDGLGEYSGVSLTRFLFSLDGFFGVSFYKRWLGSQVRKENEARWENFPRW